MGDLRKIKESRLYPGQYICKCYHCDAQFWSSKLNFICDDCREKPKKRPARMSEFREVISIGFDKYGEPDFRMTIANVHGLSIEDMHKLRSMSVLALVEVEEWWRRYRADLPENQACGASPLPPPPEQERSR